MVKRTAGSATAVGATVAVGDGFAGVGGVESSARPPDGAPGGAASVAAARVGTAVVIDGTLPSGVGVGASSVALIRANASSMMAGTSGVGPASSEPQATTVAIKTATNPIDPARIDRVELIMS